MAALTMIPPMHAPQPPSSLSRLPDVDEVRLLDPDAGKVVAQVHGILDETLDALQEGGGASTGIVVPSLARSRRGHRRSEQWSRASPRRSWPS